MYACESLANCQQACDPYRQVCASIFGLGNLGGDSVADCRKLHTEDAIQTELRRFGNDSNASECNGRVLLNGSKHFCRLLQLKFLTADASGVGSARPAGFEW